MIYCEKHRTHTDEQCSKCVIEDRENKLVESSEYFKAMCLKYKELEENLKVAIEALDKIDNSNDDMKYFNPDIHIIIHDTREKIKGTK